MFVSDSFSRINHSPMEGLRSRERSCHCCARSCSVEVWTLFFGKSQASNKISGYLTVHSWKHHKGSLFAIPNSTLWFLFSLHLLASFSAPPKFEGDSCCPYSKLTIGFQFSHLLITHNVLHTISILNKFLQIFKKD